MKLTTRRALFGFLLAPFVPSGVMWAFEFGHPAKALPAVAFGATVAYVATLPICVPAYLLITRHWRLRLVHTLVVSGIAGLLAMGFISEGCSLGAAGIGLLGLSAGATFWMIWRGAAQQGVAGDGAARRR